MERVLCKGEGLPRERSSAGDGEDIIPRCVVKQGEPTVHVANTCRAPMRLPLVAPVATARFELVVHLVTQICLFLAHTARRSGFSHLGLRRQSGAPSGQQSTLSTTDYTGK